MSASHPLDGDGVNHMLFHYLSRDATTMLAKRKDDPTAAAADESPDRAAAAAAGTAASKKKKKDKKRATEEAEFRIPDTVVFFNTPTTWYYWDETTQKCEKKDSKHLEKENLEKFFGRPVGKGCEIVASFLSRNQGGPDSVIFMDKNELHDFLYAKPEHHGLLQRFVVPAGGFNFMYQAVWCKRGQGSGGAGSMTKVFKRVSRQKLKDRFVPQDKLINPAKEGYVAFGCMARRRAKQRRAENEKKDYYRSILSSPTAGGRPGSAPPGLESESHDGLLRGPHGCVRPMSTLPPSTLSLRDSPKQHQRHLHHAPNSSSTMGHDRSFTITRTRSNSPVGYDIRGGGRGGSPDPVSPHPLLDRSGNAISGTGIQGSAHRPAPTPGLLSSTAPCISPPRDRRRWRQDLAAELEWMANGHETQPVNREIAQAAQLCKDLKAQLTSADQHYDKAITFEGSAHYAEEVLCHSGINKKISKAVAQLVTHFEALDYTYTIARLVIYFKEDMKGRLWLMFTSSVRVREARTRQEVSVPRSPTEFNDLYRFHGVLTPKFKGVYLPEEDDEGRVVSHRSRRGGGSRHSSTPTPRSGSKRRGQHGRSSGGGGDSSHHRLEYRPVNSPPPPGMDQFTRSLSKMAANNERVLAELERSTERTQAATGSCLDRIDVYNRENQLLRGCLRKRQIAYKQLCELWHSQGAGATSGEASMETIQHYPLETLMQRTKLPPAARKRTPSAAVTGAIMAAVAAIHLPPETGGSFDGKKKAGGAPSPLRRKLPMPVCPTPSGMSSSGMVHVHHGRESVADAAQVDRIVEIVARSHENQEERRFIPTEGKVLTQKEYWAAGHEKRRRSLMKHWQAAGAAGGASTFAARKQEAEAPADLLDDILYTVFNDVALARRVMQPPDHIFSKPNTAPSVRELLELYPHDYIFDVPECVAEHLVPEFEAQMEALKLRVFLIHVEYARVVDAHKEKLAQVARCPGVKASEVQAQEERLEQARGVYIRLNKQKPAPYIGGAPLALIIRQGERGTMPEYNALLQDFRAALMAPLEAESAAFQATLREHASQMDAALRELEEVTYQRGGPAPPTVESMRVSSL